MINRVVYAMSCGVSMALVSYAGAQEVTAPYEEAPVLNAREILRPDIFQGPFHQVNQPVPTYAGANRFVIESQFGRFTAEGNTLLLERVREINAIARLKEVSKGKEYAAAVKRAAMSPVELARNLARDPVDTVTSVPQGVWKFINRAGQGVKEATRRRETSQYEDNRATDLLGVSKLKREWAADLKVDPYSSNEVFQQELNGVAWTSFAGKATVSALTFGLTGGASIAVTSISFVDAANDAVRDLAPADLRLANEKRLEKMGVSEEMVTQFLDHPAFSPMHQAQMVFALEQLSGVKGRGEFLQMSMKGAQGEGDAVFFARTAQLLARLHAEGVPMARIVSLDGLPVALGPAGELTVALEWDYAAWTEGVVGFAEDLRAFANESKPNQRTRDLPRVLVALSGDASPRFQQELKDRGVGLKLRLDAPVLR